MLVGLLRRIAVILLAAAFLSGGVPVIVAPAQAAAHHDCLDCPDDDSQSPAPQLPVCAHGIDCLACVAVDLPATLHPFVVLHWTVADYQQTTTLKLGVTTRPELFPPIASV